ncbi:thiamine phosphate synthase [Latilactobacillus fuchuensis]|uniref:Thiamine-phosphate synthase n=1 Tax=Latilactobacillus fuchuensis TaxID=164393 RepID=A0A2N9DXW6_9LACO|nr:thiamine phosphate synthase [Latilactobacillus fuchuensis]MCP8857358.1 thiamine phosphate synthase [Latilactobacillus fuchuensis]SPC39650.1 Thiamine-phosphate synthase [Latilactobacillus fuchuensis]
MTNISPEILQTYLVTGTQDTGVAQFLPTLEAALNAGITCFQFREKGPNSLQSAAEIEHYARQAQQLCRTYQVPFFIDDRLELALTLQADGLHVGQSDQPWAKIETAKRHGLITGLSCHSAAEIIVCHQQPILDYLGIGPIFPTHSKSDAQSPLGLQQLGDFVSLSERPVVAIGGISLQNIANVAQTGVAGAAVISVITQSSDIAQTVQALKQPWHTGEASL